MIDNGTEATNSFWTNMQAAQWAAIATKKKPANESL